MSEHEGTLQQLKVEVEELESGEGEMKASLVDLRHELDKYNTKLKDGEQKIKYYKGEVRGQGSGVRVWC